MSFDAQWLGFSAAICTTLAFIPQAIKVLHSGRTEGLSLQMYTLFVCGTTLWMFYGLVIRDGAIILANVITTFFALLILIKIFLNRKHLC